MSRFDRFAPPGFDDDVADLFCPNPDCKGKKDDGTTVVFRGAVGRYDECPYCRAVGERLNPNKSFLEQILEHDRRRVAEEERIARAGVEDEL